MEWQRQEAHPKYKNMWNFNRRRGHTPHASSESGTISRHRRRMQADGLESVIMCCKCSDGREDCEEEAAAYTKEESGGRRQKV